MYKSIDDTTIPPTLQCMKKYSTQKCYDKARGWQYKNSSPDTPVFSILFLFTLNYQIID